MAPKIDPQVSAQGTGESSDTNKQQMDLDQLEEAPGAGMERVTCPVDGCGWFQRVTKEFPASEANRSAELHMLGAHDLRLGGSMAQYAASVDATLALLRE